MTSDNVTERRQGGNGFNAFVSTAAVGLILLAAAFAIELYHQFLTWPLGAGNWEVAEVIALGSSICAMSTFSLGAWRRLVRVTTERDRAEEALLVANEELRDRTAELRSVNASLQGELSYLKQPQTDPAS